MYHRKKQAETTDWMRCSVTCKAKAKSRWFLLPHTQQDGVEVGAAGLESKD